MNQIPEAFSEELRIDTKLNTPVNQSELKSLDEIFSEEETRLYAEMICSNH